MNKVIKKLRVHTAIFLIVLFSFSIVYAVGAISTGFRANDSSQTIDAHNFCKKVRKTSGDDVFVPTKTSAEWSAFMSNKPDNIELSSCITCTRWHSQNDPYPHSYWYVFKAYGSNPANGQIRWYDPAVPPILGWRGSPSVTEQVVSGYTFIRGEAIWETSLYASYYIKRCI